MHVGSSSQVPQIAPDAPFMANLTWGATRTSGTMLSWLFSGLFQRYPNLKIALSEGEIGWMPYFLERAEQVLDKQRYWVSGARRSCDHAKASTSTSTPSTSGNPSATTSTAASSRTATRSRAWTKSARTTSCARPTTRTRTPPGPNCIDVARNTMKDLPENVQYKLLRGNAERLYRFTPAEPPVLANA